MKHICDAVVIGSGIVGSAAAHALLRAGIRRVHLVDKGPLVSGMTRRSAGLVHPFAFHLALAELAAAGFAFYNTWALHLGAGKSPFVLTGAVVLPDAAPGRSPQVVSAPPAAAAPLDRASLAGMFPGFVVRPENDPLLYTPNAGYADAVQTTQAFVEGAKTRGLQVHTGAQVKQIQVEAGQVRGLLTTADTFEAPLVLVAAGGWSERLFATFGLALHLKFRRGVVLFYDQPPALTQGHPLLLDSALTTFLRPHPYRMSAGGALSPDPVLTSADSPDETVTAADNARVVELAAQAIPAFAGTTPRRAHTILYDTPTDGLPALGRVPGVDGLLIAVGFGTAAFTVAPAVGQALAEIVTDGASQLDVSAFEVARLL